MKFIRSLYFHNMFFWWMASIAVCSAFGFIIPLLYSLAKLLFISFLVILILDLLLLFLPKNGVKARRLCPEKLSNGDDNLIQIWVRNQYAFQVNVEVIDELPPQFQIRDFLYDLSLNPKDEQAIKYNLRPTLRGDYDFGKINVYASSFLKLLKRRYQFEEDSNLCCYPSFIQMRKYELLAVSNRLSEYGVKKVRKIGNQNEFDQIREYVKGDDYRIINWKATARKNQFMVNQFQDEKSQPIYAIIDGGRSMKMPFNGLSLQDYAINSGLVLANTAILKHDKAGLICFDKTVKQHLPASGKKTQVKKIMEALYNAKTVFPEPNFELLYASINRFVKSRSLLMLYTNFESLDSMKRNLPYLQAIAKKHLLVVVFFSNSEIEGFLTEKSVSLKDIYDKTIAEKMLFEKKMITKELEKRGIHTVYTSPEHLNVKTLNKYLELKTRGLL